MNMNGVHRGLHRVGEHEQIKNQLHCNGQQHQSVRLEVNQSLNARNGVNGMAFSMNSSSRHEMKREHSSRPQPPESGEDKDDDNKNPWFNEEIAAIVKLHRKTIRKYHRSKTKKVELKQQCKELEKRKRKLIKAAKQRYSSQSMATMPVHSVSTKMGANSEAQYVQRREYNVNASEKGNHRRSDGMFKEYGHRTSANHRNHLSPRDKSRQSRENPEEARDESNGNAFPKTHIENVRQIDASLIPNVDIPQFFKTASKQIYQICDTYL